MGGIAVGIYYALFISGWMAVRDITIEQESFVKSEEIRGVVEAYLQERNWFVPMANNIWGVDDKKIVSGLAQRFPVLKDIKVEKKYFHGLIIKAGHREAVGIWCFQKQNECFYFDQEGIAFDRAADSSGTLFLIVHDYLENTKELGQKVADGESFDRILELKKELDWTKVGISRIVIPEELFRINVKTTEGWEAYFSTADPLIPQTKALSIFLANKVSFEQRGQLQYIDARIHQRVYYKLINSPPIN